MEGFPKRKNLSLVSERGILMIKLKRCWQLFLALSCIFLSLGLTGGQVKGQEVNFSIPQQWIEAKVNPDGSVTFEDYQKYQADFMNGARFTLDHQGYELTDFQVGVADSLKAVSYTHL